MFILLLLMVDQSRALADRQARYGQRSALSLLCIAWGCLLHDHVALRQPRGLATYLSLATAAMSFVANHGCCQGPRSCRLRAGVR